MNWQVNLLRDMRDAGEDWKEYVTRLMQEQGVIDEEHKPSDEALRRYDKKRKKKVSNDEWVSSTDHDGRITKMKEPILRSTCWLIA